MGKISTVAINHKLPEHILQISLDEPFRPASTKATVLAAH
jgi:hypothetical protein